MEDAVVKESSLKELLLKTNHPILDIRCRSIESIIFKLNNGLLATSDLAKERDFLANLLEWFNFEEWALEMQVLLLLTQLSKHVEAASALVDLGGVEFLSQLRLHCDDSLHPLIDEILEHLLQLPDYQASSSDPGPTGTSAVTATSSIPVQAGERGATSSSTTAFSTFKSELTSDNGGYSGYWQQDSHTSQAQPTNQVLPYHFLPAIPAGHTSPRAPIFQHANPELTEVGGNGDSQKSDRLEAGYFPWLTLTSNDHHVLSTTETRLEFPSTESLLHSCDFLEDVLFQDFPPELFLQRPTILSRLLWLLTSADWNSTHFPCLSCLLSYSKKLRARVKLMTHYPSSSRLDYTGLGAGSCDQKPRDYFNSRHQDKEMEYLSQEEVDALHASQYSVPSFSSSLMTTVAPILLDHLNRDFPWAVPAGKQRPSFPVVAATFANKCLMLLEAAVDITELVYTGCQNEHVQEEEEMECRTKTLRQCVGALCSVATQCLSKWRTLVTKKPRLSQVQLVCCVTLNLGCFIDRLTQLGGRDCWMQRQHQLPSVPALRDALEGFIMNGPLSIACPKLRSSLHLLFREMDPGTSAVFDKVIFLSEAFQSKSKLMTSSLKTTPTNELLKLAFTALPGQWFYCDDAFVEKAVHFSMICICKCDKGDVDWCSGKNLALKLLGHGEPQTKQCAFIHFMDLLSRSLSLPSTSHLSSSVLASVKPPTGPAEQSVVHPSKIELSDSRHVRSLEKPEEILLDQDLLHVLIMEGAMSSSGIVSSLCQELLGDALSLRDKVYWPQLRDSLLPHLPYMEAVASDNDHLFQELKFLLCQSGQLSDIVQLCSFLRLLYSASEPVRKWSCTSLLELLSKRSSDLVIAPLDFSHLPHNVMIEGQERQNFNIGLTTLREGEFKHEDVVKLLNIAMSESMTVSLRKSALEQLVLLLQDRSLHMRVLSDGLLSDLIQLLETTLLQLKKVMEPCPQSEQVQSEWTCLLKSCVRCLWVLSTYGPGVQMSLSEDFHSLKVIFQAAVLFHQDREVTTMVSRLLFLLLFVKEVKISEDGKTALPAQIQERLRFPFEVSAYEIYSVQSNPSPLEGHSYSSEQFLSMLRIQYLYSSAESIERILINQEKSDNKLLDQKLMLTESELVSLHCLEFGKSLVDSCDSLSSATSHMKIVEILQHMTVVIYSNHCLAGKLQRNSDFKLPNKKLTLVMERFLRVTPSTPQDRMVLTSIISFYTDIFLHSKIDSDSTKHSLRSIVTHEELPWLIDVFLGPRCVPLRMLQSSLSEEEGSSEQETSSRRLLQKPLLLFYSYLLSRLVGLYSTSQMRRFDPAPLMKILGQSLEVAGSPNFKDIPLLELTLECLTCVTDRYLLADVPGSLLGLSMKILSSLRQVLWSFLSGQGCIESSFMGKGVVSKASLIMAHLTFSTSHQPQCPKEWWSQWLQSSDIGLTWLHRLLQDRKPEARFAAFSFLASLVSQPEAAPLLVVAWTPLNPFGLWGISLSSALDVNENSMVRKQALVVIRALSEVCIKEDQWNHYLECTTSNMSVSGEEALEFLLDFYKFSETLLLVFQTDSVGHFTPQLSACVRNLIEDEDFLSFLVPTSCYPGSQQVQLEGADVAASGDKLKALLAAVIDALNPHVIAGFCGFIHNIYVAFPECVSPYLHHCSLVVHLTRLLDPLLICAFLEAQRNGIISTIASYWIGMCIRVLQLLQTLVCITKVTDSDIGNSVIDRLAKICTLCHLFLDSSSNCICLASAVVSFLWTLVCVNSSVDQEKLFSSVQTHWKSFTGLFLHSMQTNSSISLKLRTSSLHLLHYILSKQCQPYLLRDSRKHKVNFDPSTESSSSSAKALVFLLDSDGTTEASQCCGGIICASLLKARDCDALTTTVDMEGKEDPCQYLKQIQDTLSVLLACSTSAKQVALASGLLDLSTDELKMAHTKLCAELLDQPITLKRKKETSLVNQMVTFMNLLRNFMYKSQIVKTSALNGHLTSVIHKIWPSCTVHMPLLQACLDLLAIFIARHPQGRASLAISSKGSSSLMQDILKHAMHTVSCYYSCVSAKLANPHADVVGPLFSFLANSTLSPECRSVLRKSTFLNGFAQVQPKTEKSGSGSHGIRISSMWMQLLLNLSFSTDGITVITKTEGMMEALLDVYGCGPPSIQIICLLIFRNFAFYGPSRTLLTNDDGLLNILLVSLDSSHLLRVALAASALWAIIYYSSKMRTSLKKSGLYDKLSSSYTKMKRLCSSEFADINRCEKWCFEAQEQAMQLLM